MARLARTGASAASLYEFETNPEEVISDLGLANMSADAKREIRGALEKVMGRGYDEVEMSQKLNPGSERTTKGITANLAAMARHLQDVEKTLRGAETGLRESHDTAVALKVRALLAANPEIGGHADEFLRDFCDRMSTVAHACLAAAKDLRSTKGKEGRKALDWYNDFTRVLVAIAKQNGIRPTVTINRDTSEPEGRFLGLATAFETLLSPSMRSPSDMARAKRLSRALAALNNRPRRR